MGDRLELEGSYTVRVLYLDAQGNTIRCCENARPFSTSIALKRAADNALAFVKTRVEYINCRATSPRRLDIHGAFSVCAKIWEPVRSELTGSVEGDDIQMKQSRRTASQVVGYSQQQFSVTEVLEISGGKPPAETILRSGASCTLQDFKIVANKLIVKGEVLLKILYSPGIDSAEPEAMEYVVPYSQMLDCNGVEEDCVCDVSVDIMSFNLDIKSDSSGENTLFEADIKLIGDAVAYRDTEITVATDVYSTERELAVAYKPTVTERILDVFHDSYVQKNNIDLGDLGVTKVLDVWNEMSTVTAAQEDQQIVYRGKMNICILAVNTEWKPFYLERMVDFEYTHDWAKQPEGMVCYASVSIPNISYRIVGDSNLETKTEVHLSSSVFLRESCQMIADVTGDDDHLRQKDTAAALTIYYADAGESLWDIARTYCTSVDAIMAENGMEEEMVENGSMLLIPM